MAAWSMSGPPSPRPDVARSWVERAEEDLRVAEHTLHNLNPCPYWAVAFHAQQAVEKAVKAVLVGRGIDFRPTHDISALLDTALASGEPWVDELREAASLTAYAVAGRYPNPRADLKQEEAVRACEIARRGVDQLRYVVNGL